MTVSDAYSKLINSDIQFLKGVGEKRATLFSRLGISVLWDLIYFFPREYDDRRKICAIADLPEGATCCVRAIPRSAPSERRFKRNLAVYSLYVDDGTGGLHVKWFSAPQYKRKIELGEEYIFYGTCAYAYGRREMELVAMERVGTCDQTGRIVPVYPLTKGLTQQVVRSAVAQALGKVERLYDILPADLREKYHLLDMDRAVRQMHFPEDMELFERARKRLVFEELLVLQLSLLMLRERRSALTGMVFADTGCVKGFLSGLPFVLTDAQQGALDEILEDLKGGKPMNRLVQGDVGSGKTVVAAAAAYCAVRNGHQAAMMAPTEILAVQHYHTFRKFFGEDVRIALLTGSSKGKKQLLEQIAAGEYDIIIGTHALLEKGVEFASLGLCITDEQHRFGVNQRAALSGKGQACHVLVMSATPIPRTLALILYGDLDISIIGALPKGRKPIDTYCVKTALRRRAYGFVRKQLEEGRQGYVVCPLVEESDKLDVASGVEFYEKLRTEVFPDYRVGLLHGRMKPQEKDAVMGAFQKGEIDLLVSTTVIEVGVDVPNANIMVIENAERFGLSQLHQLRGRVGRGEHQSHCILITDSDNEQTRERMGVMTRTNDGFEISQKDLQLRGCGEFFGTRQHGLPELKVANLFTDLGILKTVQEEAKEMLDVDPTLNNEKNASIRARIEGLFGKFERKDIFN
ncbi:MAG: ATP-dependent DNA helicase RecG [Ruminococcaceae bacterium]|nr:ATP-dependent DNA helicase RecG [Oscillospiraceae bacterium]